MERRVVNVNFKCCGLNFDAAIDCNWTLHDYDIDKDECEKVVPIELYCFDEDWDVKVVFYKENDLYINSQNRSFNHTKIDWDFVIKETRKWVREMKK